MALTIFVLPTQKNRPPRAFLFTTPDDLEEEKEGDENDVTMGVGQLVTWSLDSGTWMTGEDTPVPTDLAEAITAHAKDLGVEW